MKTIFVWTLQVLLSLVFASSAEADPEGCRRGVAKAAAVHAQARLNALARYPRGRLAELLRHPGA